MTNGDHMINLVEHKAEHFQYLKDFLKKILFIDLTETRREGIQARGLGEEEGEAGFLLSREPDVGLDHRTLDHDLSRRLTLNN